MDPLSFLAQSSSSKKTSTTPVTNRSTTATPTARSKRQSQLESLLDEERGVPKWKKTKIDPKYEIFGGLVDKVVPTTDSAVSEGDSLEDTLQKLQKNVDVGYNEPTLSKSSVRRSISQLRTIIAKNAEMRTQFSDSPESFMESEVNLNEALQRVSTISTHPEFFPSVVDAGFVEVMVQLLSHDNLDICIHVISILNDFSDPDNLIEDAEEVEIELEEQEEKNPGFVSLANALNSQAVYKAIESHLRRLVESIKKSEKEGTEVVNEDEVSSIEKCFQLFEMIVDFHPESANEIAKSTSLLQFLVEIVANDKSDSSALDNRLAASELIVILVTLSESGRDTFHQHDLLEPILKVVSKFRMQSEFASPDEEEMLCNIFDTICASFLSNKNRNAFIRMEGVELMTILFLPSITSKSQSIWTKTSKNVYRVLRSNAAKVLSHCISNNVMVANRVVDCERTLSRLLGSSGLMHVGKHKHKSEDSFDFSNHVVSILFSVHLLHLLSDDLQRLSKIHKRWEKSNCAAVVMLVEMHEVATSKIDALNALIEKRDNDDLLDDNLESMSLFLHEIDMLLAMIIFAEKKLNIDSTANRNLPIYSAMNDQLVLHGLNWNSIIDNVQVYRSSLGSDLETCEAVLSIIDIVCESLQ